MLQCKVQEFDRWECTFNRLAVLGSMTLRKSRTSCVREEPTWPCLIMNDFGVPATGVAMVPLRCVLFFRLRPMLSLRENLIKLSKTFSSRLYLFNATAKQSLIMSRLASFRGPSTPSSSPIQVKLISPGSPSRSIESTYHRKIRTHLQELRSTSETWNALILVDGLKAAKSLVDTRTDLEYASNYLPTHSFYLSFV